MHCPQCGQEQVSAQTRFCSRCGFPLTGVAELLLNGGISPNSIQTTASQTISPRKKGLRQGLFIFLLSFLVIPLLAILTVMAGVQEPFIVAIAAILLTVGGLLRMAYALMFESANPGEATLEQNVLAKTQSFLNKNQQSNALPPQQTIPITAYVPPSEGNWRDTNDLTHTTVTDHTTKLLQKEE